MTLKLMLDSGAYSVWKSGASIDLAEYVGFCARHPKCTYYVNLDVIPGKFKDKRSITKSGVEESCKAGWLNYKMMIKELPQSKVIPVFHQNDPHHWFDKYLNAGADYVGISPANDCGPLARRAWLRSVRHLLFDGAGRPVCKTHGFGVSCADLMTCMEWHSVDSATWKQMASWGIILLPEEPGGRPDYSRDWFDVFVSEASPHRKRRNQHYASANPVLKARVLRALERHGMKFGRSEIVKVPPEYRLHFREAQGVVSGEGESWYDREKRLVLRPVEIGVSNSFKERCKFNIHFHKGQQRDCPVKYVYLAGSPTPYSWETKMGYRLLSYDVVKTTSGIKKLNRHLVTM